MWAVFLPYLVKYALPLNLTLLQKTGFVNTAEALAGKFIVRAAEEAESVKFSQEYPTGKNGNDQRTPVAETNINQDK